MNMLNARPRPLMTWFATVSIVLTLAACGGGSTVTNTTSSTSTSTTPSTTTTTPTLRVGVTYPIQASSSVNVPKGTVITAPSGVASTLNNATAALNVPAGSIITIPTTATGTATILVTAFSNSASSIATTLPTTAAFAGVANLNWPPTDGTVTTAIFAGNGRLAFDATGTLFLSDFGSLRKITTAGVVTTLSKAYDPYYWEGIAIDATGKVFGGGLSYAPPPDMGGASIRTFSTDGTLGTLVNNWITSPTVSAPGSGGLVVDSSGNLFTTDTLNHRIVKFTATGVMSVFAGTGSAGVVDGLGITAKFNAPTELAIDSTGNLWVSDTGNNAIRKITPAGVVSTVANVPAPGPIALESKTGVLYFMAGSSSRTLYRFNKDLNTLESYPLAGITDTITGLTVSSKGVVYAGTRGAGTQIYTISF